MAPTWQIPCRFYERGHCRRGDTCCYKHGDAVTLNPIPSVAAAISLSADTASHNVQLASGSPGSSLTSSTDDRPSSSSIVGAVSSIHRASSNRDTQSTQSTSTSNGVPGSSTITTRPRTGAAIASMSTASEAETCIICFEKPTKYGLLESCMHIYCLTCIREWRTERGKTPDQIEGDVLKRCPACREHSHFVIPSNYTFTAQQKAEKARFIKRYKDRLSVIPCNHFAASARTFCPFGKDCFYDHTNYDGTPHIFTHGMAEYVSDRREERNAERLERHLRNFYRMWRDGRLDETGGVDYGLNGLSGYGYGDEDGGDDDDEDDDDDSEDDEDEDEDEDEEDEDDQEDDYLDEETRRLAELGWADYVISHNDDLYDDDDDINDDEDEENEEIDEEDEEIDEGDYNSEDDSEYQEVLALVLEQSLLEAEQRERDRQIATLSARLHRITGMTSHPLLPVIAPASQRQSSPQDDYHRRTSTVQQGPAESEPERSRGSGRRVPAASSGARAVFNFHTEDFAFEPPRTMPVVSTTQRDRDIATVPSARSQQATVTVSRAVVPAVTVHGPGRDTTESQSSRHNTHRSAQQAPQTTPTSQQVSDRGNANGTSLAMLERRFLSIGARFLSEAEAESIAMSASTSRSRNSQSSTPSNNTDSRRTPGSSRRNRRRQAV